MTFCWFINNRYNVKVILNYSFYHDISQEEKHPL